MGIAFLFLQPNINQLLNNLNTKRPQFDTALFGILDVRSLIHDTLVVQQNGSEALGKAVSLQESSKTLIMTYIRVVADPP